MYIQVFLDGGLNQQRMGVCYSIGFPQHSMDIKRVKDVPNSNDYLA